LLCVLKYDLFWRKFHDLQKRMCIVWLLGEILCRYLPFLFDLICRVALKFLFLFLSFFLFIFCLDDHFIVDSEMGKLGK
jgi:hypothetical protein